MKKGIRLKKFIPAAVPALLMLIVLLAVSSFSAPASVSMNSRNWMSGIPDDTAISDITIPGTRDSGMMYAADTMGGKFLYKADIADYGVTQSMNITSQLNAGVRLLDLSFTFEGEKSEALLVRDAAVTSDEAAQQSAQALSMTLFGAEGLVPSEYVRGLSFRFYGLERYRGTVRTMDTIFSDVTRFLQNNPTETVVIRLRSDADEEGLWKLNRFFAELAKKENTRNGKAFLYAEKDKRNYEQLPSLGKCRGQIVLLSDLNDENEIFGYGMPYSAVSGSGLLKTVSGDELFVRTPKEAASDAAYTEKLSSIAGVQQILQEAGRNHAWLLLDHITKEQSDTVFRCNEFMDRNVTAAYIQIYSVNTENRDVTTNSLNISDQEKLQLSRLSALKQESYTVLFNTNGGTSVPAQSVLPEGTMKEPETEPFKVGYTFNGWSTDVAGKEMYDFSTPVTKNMTLYASQTPDSYTVTFDPNGGTMDEEDQTQEVTAAKNFKVSEPSPKPKRDGLEFDGWYAELPAGSVNLADLPIWKENSESITDKDISEDDVWKDGDKVRIRYDFDNYAINSDITLTARWVAVVTFNTNSEQGNPDSQRIDVGGTVTEPADPAKEGFEFAGWFKGSTQSGEGMAEKYKFSSPVEKSFVLHAQWVQRELTLTYISNGVEVHTQKVMAGVSPYNSANRVGTPQEAGMVFEGWYTDNEYTTLFSDKTPLFKDMTVYAKWSKKTYTVSFRITNGIAPDKQVVETGEKAVKPEVPAIDGYTFDNWYSSSTYANVFDFESPITKDTTIYGRYTVNRWTVSFDPNGGIGLMDPVTTVELSDYVLPLNRYTAPEGKVFAGWNLGNVGEKIKVTENITLVAQWKDDAKSPTYTVSFYTDGGSEVASQTVKRGEKAIRPADPEKEGYHFDGWYRSIMYTSAYTFDSPVISNLMIYAKWSTDNVTVHFDANGGSGTMDDVLSKKDAAYKLPSCSFTGPRGRAFDRWSLGNPGDEVVLRADTIVYAIWKGADYSYMNETTTPTAPTETAYSGGTTTGGGTTNTGTTTPTLAYTITEGMNTVRERKATEDLKVVVHRSIDDASCYAHFLQVKIDDQPLLLQTDYTAESGSLILYLKDSALDKLSDDMHKLTIVFDDGEVSTALWIGQQTERNTTAPVTGDPTNLGFWFVMLGLSGILAGALVLLQLKKRKNAV